MLLLESAKWGFDGPAPILEEGKVEMGGKVRCSRWANHVLLLSIALCSPSGFINAPAAASATIEAKCAFVRHNGVLDFISRRGRGGGHFHSSTMATLRRERGGWCAVRHPGVMPLRLVGNTANSNFQPLSSAMGINLQYEFEQSSSDTRAVFWRQKETALKPRIALRSPAIAAQTLIAFHQKSVANLTSLIQFASAPNMLRDTNRLRNELANISALLIRETAMRHEVAALVQILLESSSLRCSGTLAVEGWPEWKEKLEPWLTAVPADSGPVGPVHSSELARVLEDCKTWQNSKHTEEQAVLLPLIAASCLKSVAARRRIRDAKGHAEIQAVERWLLSHVAPRLHDFKHMQDGYAKNLVSNDPSGSLLFCKSTCAMIRYELLELSRLASELSIQDSTQTAFLQRQIEGVLQRFALLVEARRCVYVSVLHPRMPKLHHVCVSHLTDQVPLLQHPQTRQKILHI